MHQNIGKKLLYSKRGIYYNSTSIDKRTQNEAGITTTGLNAA